MLQAFDAHLSEAGIGSVSEIFDAEPRTRRAAASRKPGASPKCCGLTARPAGLILLNDRL